MVGSEAIEHLFLSFERKPDYQNLYRELPAGIRLLELFAVFLHRSPAKSHVNGASRVMAKCGQESSGDRVNVLV